MEASITSEERWEAFSIEGKKVGFTRRVTRVDAHMDGVVTELTTAFQVDGHTMGFHHVFHFSRRHGFPWTSYTFTQPDGSKVEVAFDGKRLHGKSADGPVDKPVPSDTVPTYGFYPRIITMPFQAGKSVRFTGMEDASCELMPETELVSVGWEETKVAGEMLKLWRVEESAGGKRGNTYWLDEHHHLRKADWQGAQSIRVSGREEALQDLPAEVARFAH